MWDEFKYNHLLKIPPPKKPCFLAGTMVQTEQGPMAIEDIKQGIRVLAFNRQTRQNELRPVTEVFSNHTEKYVEIHTAAGDVLKATGAHLFYEHQSEKWVAASALKAGMHLASLTHEAIGIDRVLTVAENQATYNLEVEELHNYYAGTLEPVLTHNADRYFRYADLTKYEFIHYVLKEQGKELYVGITAQESLNVRAHQHELEGKRALQEGIKPQNAWKAGRISADYINLPAHLTSGVNSPIKMTFFEARVIEMYEMQERRSRFNLKNTSYPMSEKSFNRWKSTGKFNPCLFYV